MKKSRRRGRKLTKTQARQVKTIISRKQELKFRFETQNAAVVSNSGAVSPLILVGQGVTDTQRVGDSLTLCGKLDLKYAWQIAPNSNKSYALVRFIIFQFHPSTDNVTPSYPSANQILLPGPSGAVDVYSWYAHDYRQDYTILYDKTMELIGPGVYDADGSGSNEMWPVTCCSFKHVSTRISLKKARKNQQFQAGTLSGTNCLYKFQISSVPSADNPPTIISNAKMYFRDS